jgi:hypothetical protein
MPRQHLHLLLALTSCAEQATAQNQSAEDRRESTADALSRLRAEQALNQARAMRGNLSGVHLKITMIHSTLGTDMGYDDPSRETLTPFWQWRGFWVDVLDWVANHAGFTYELYSPSGEGADCVLPAGAVHSRKAYATQFNCGANDVYDLNLTDVYWNGFYISPSRLSRNLFTVPMLSDVGLGLVVKKSGRDTFQCARFQCPRMLRAALTRVRVVRGVVCRR